MLITHNKRKGRATPKKQKKTAELIPGYLIDFEGFRKLFDEPVDKKACNDVIRIMKENGLYDFACLPVKKYYRSDVLTFYLNASLSPTTITLPDHKKEEICIQEIKSTINGKEFSITLEDLAEFWSLPIVGELEPKSSEGSKEFWNLVAIPHDNPTNTFPLDAKLVKPAWKEFQNWLHKIAEGRTGGESSLTLPRSATLEAMLNDSKKYNWGLIVYKRLAEAIQKEIDACGTDRDHLNLKKGKGLGLHLSYLLEKNNVIIGDDGYTTVDERYYRFRYYRFRGGGKKAN